MRVCDHCAASLEGRRQPPATAADRARALSGLDVVEVDLRLLGRGCESTFDSRLHPRHQDVVAEALPALLRLVDGHDGPATLRGARGVKDLAVRQLIWARVNRSYRRLVLLLRPTREVVDDSKGHTVAPS